MRVFKQLVFLLVGWIVLNFTSANGQNRKEPSARQIYTDAKKQFDEFERLHGRFVHTDNVKMHYLSWGNPDNPCLIWAHGSMNSGYELVNIADRLVEAGYFVIAIDYYGHGQTPIPDHEVSIYHIADDIKFLMDQLSIKKAYIGGFSRGGYVATAFYQSYPDCVSGLILEDGGSVAANTYYQRLEPKKLEKLAEDFNRKQSAPWDSTYRTEYDAFTALYDQDDPNDQFSILALLSADGKGNWRIVYSEMMKLFNLENSRQFLDLALRPAVVPLFARSMVMIEPQLVFRNLKVPVLILDPVIENDPMPFQQENEGLKSMHPDLIEHIIYPDTEHNIHYAQPKRFIRDVVAFLNKSNK